MCDPDLSGKHSPWALDAFLRLLLYPISRSNIIAAAERTER